ncbi:MAG TPA: DEAD/DEAH box helicase, partial [Anaerolineae bacterium]|nr:DEAD/DEAH box helicase [Anaerolineae bacterium]
MNPERVRDEVVKLGRKTYAASILNYLATSDDPLPLESDLLAATEAKVTHLAKLEADGLIERVPAKTVQITNPEGELVEIEEAAVVGLAIRPNQTLQHILKLRGAEKYYAILTHLAEAAQPVRLKSLYEATGASRTHLNKLAQLDLIRFGAEHIWRDSLADRDFVPATAPPLTSDQNKIWQIVAASLTAASLTELTEADNSTATPQPRNSATAAPLTTFLLHGVTGSGKTEIYMHAIEKVLARGQQAIVLVPEIALTPQTVRRFAARFPGRVAMMHSRLSTGERYDTWRRARLGMFDIIVGPRSALFTPFANVGVIVLDEEHDGSYKQTPPVPPPYYHARATAIAMGKITGATVILGSATPDLVTYHAARSGEITLLELPKRVMGHRQRIVSQSERIGRK